MGGDGTTEIEGRREKEKAERKGERREKGESGEKRRKRERKPESNCVCNSDTASYYEP